MAPINKTLKTCKNGHIYYKSSDCPVCPQCEINRKPSADFLNKLSAPARRALESNGITSIDLLVNFSENKLLQFHGFGKSSIPKIESILAEKGLHLKIND